MSRWPLGAVTALVRSYVQAQSGGSSAPALLKCPSPGSVGTVDELESTDDSTSESRCRRVSRHMGTQAYQQLRDAIAISERTSAGRVSLFVMVVECRRLDWRIRCVLAQSPMRPHYTHRHTDRDCACMHVMYVTCVCMTKSDSICKQPLLCV